MGIVISTHLPPPVMIESTEVLKCVTHVVLDLGHVLFGCGLLRERPRQHEFGLEYCPGPLHDAVEGRHHPRDCRMLHAALDVSDMVAGVALVPGPVELLGSPPELHDEVAGQVLRFSLTTFFAPQLDQGCFIAAHDDAGVGAADEGAALGRGSGN
jgi:hypothetical protein